MGLTHTHPSRKGPLAVGRFASLLGTQHFEQTPPGLLTPKPGSRRSHRADSFGATITHPFGGGSLRYCWQTRRVCGGGTLVHVWQGTVGPRHPGMPPLRGHSGRGLGPGGSIGSSPSEGGCMTSPLFDPDSPYASLNAHDHGGYMRATVKDHPVADNRQRVRLHRAVLFDAIGPGPHACGYCGIGGLRWDVGTTDPTYLTVDHVNHVKTDCRLGNLRAAHKYCNDNRAIVERLRIPWEAIAAIPLADRPSLRARDGEPTDAALELAASPADIAATVSADEGVGVPASAPAPVLAAPVEPVPAGVFYTWDDFRDGAEFAKGKVRLVGPPERLMREHPTLRRVDFSRFGR